MSLTVRLTSPDFTTFYLHADLATEIERIVVESGDFCFMTSDAKSLVSFFRIAVLPPHEEKIRTTLLITAQKLKPRELVFEWKEDFLAILEHVANIILDIRPIEIAGGVTAKIEPSFPAFSRRAGIRRHLEDVDTTSLVQALKRQRVSVTE